MGSRLSAASRQRLLAEAVVRVLAHGGFEAATVRSVAAEAGVSAGAVQQQFATKDALLLAGVRLMTTRFAERTARIPAPATPRELTRALLLHALPLDDERREDALVWSALVDRAGRSPEVGAAVRAVDAEALDGLTDVLGSAYVPGAARAAALLLAVCDGLAARLTYDPDAVDAALGVIEDALDAVFSNT
ncbi:MAG: TetR/AcrR family transcriptional regulator [Actinomycetota bacterium]|nr:TetR/AcrR family transcriptional regulator [Actinomycetota bacterium]